VLEPQASRLTALLWYDHVPVDGCSRVFGGTEYNRQAGLPWSQRKRSNFISRALHGKVENPTHGSAGIVQVRPTKELVLKYPNPTQRQLVDFSSPAFRLAVTSETATLLEVVGEI